MASASPRSDPIRARYYAALTRAEFWGDCAFWVTAVLSLVVLFVSEKDYPKVFRTLNVAFAVAVFTVFAIGLLTRIYWMPRALHARIQNFFGVAFNAPLTHMQTVGYYNNSQTEPIRRIAAMTMENAFFSKSIALRMLHSERARAAVYVLVYLTALTNRTTEIGLIVGLSQIVFSEQVIVKWIRLEWLRQRCERTYDSLWQLFHSAPPLKAVFDAQALTALTGYETAKANAAITFPDKLFDKMNASLSTEWDQIRRQLSL